MTKPAPKPVNPKVQVLAPAEGERLDVMGTPILVKSGNPTASFIVEHPIPPGFHVPMHFHEAEDESFYVLEGEVTFETEDGIAHVGPGGFVHCPRGARHAFRNETGRNARALVVASAGGGLGPMFREFDKTVQGGAALTPDRLTGIAAENGIRML
jgi:quercetin dioxygenase-like cupin family protein